MLFPSFQCLELTSLLGQRVKAAQRWQEEGTAACTSSAISVRHRLREASQRSWNERGPLRCALCQWAVTPPSPLPHRRQGCPNQPQHRPPSLCLWSPGLWVQPQHLPFSRCARGCDLQPQCRWFSQMPYRLLKAVPRASFLIIKVLPLPESHPLFGGSVWFLVLSPSPIPAGLFSGALACNNFADERTSLQGLSAPSIFLWLEKGEWM